MHPAPFTVVVAPDSLKGSCSARDAAAALARGVREVAEEAAIIREIPMADGGEGTLDALAAAWDGTVAEVATTDALGRPRYGRILIDAAPGRPRRVLIETADANGLPAVADQPLRPLDTDSAGVGLLVRAALDAGAEELLLCIGGSATSDGGSGMLRALGARFLDDAGADVAPGARGLADLAVIDISGLDPRAARVRWRFACDVDNPLTGPRGAAAVFGPQKGATAADIAAIDAGLMRLAGAAGAAADGRRGLPDPASRRATLQERAGLGAAGGLAVGPVALFGADLVPGADLVSEAVGLRAAVADADLVLTGEGRLDAQSLDGKVVSGVLAATRAGQDRAPAVVVIAGSVALDPAAARDAGITAVLSIARGPAALDELRADAPTLLAQAATQATALVLAGRDSGRRDDR